MLVICKIQISCLRSKSKFFKVKTSYSCKTFLLYNFLLFLFRTKLQEDGGLVDRNVAIKTFDYEVLFYF